MTRYGEHEWRYAEPIAGALEREPSFRAWFLRQTNFHEHADYARLLHEEQKIRRSASAETWWRSYWTTRSYSHFAECGERETDLLAVFEVPSGFRFALHVEVKAPGDRFGLEQARDYGRRAVCWKGRGREPGTVLPHDEAGTVLCCSASFASLYPRESQLFDSVVLHEDTKRWIPELGV
jgi:hypothetical protein